MHCLSLYSQSFSVFTFFHFLAISPVSFPALQPGTAMTPLCYLIQSKRMEVVNRQLPQVWPLSAPAGIDDGWKARTYEKGVNRLKTEVMRLSYGDPEFRESLHVEFISASHFFPGRA